MFHLQSHKLFQRCPSNAFGTAHCTVPNLVPSFTIVSQRNRPHLTYTPRPVQRNSSPPSATLSPAEVTDEPRQSVDALPANWDANELADAAIERELKRLRSSGTVPAHKLRTQPRSVHKIRSRVLRRKRSHARRNKTTSDADTLAHKNVRLSISEQKRLCGILQEWNKVQKLASTAQGEEDLAKKAGLQKGELKWLLSEGPFAASALLASVDPLLNKISRHYLFQGAEFEDVKMEAERLWLEAAAKCDWSRSSLNTFGVMYVRQRLPRTVDEQQSLLEKPALAIQQGIKIQRKETELTERFNRPSTPEEIAAELNLSRIRVVNLLKNHKREISLDGPAWVGQGLENNDETVGEAIPSLESSSGQDTVYNGAVRIELSQHMERLLQTHVTDKVDQEMVLLRYGFQDGHGHTLEMIGDRFGWSKETVRKRIKKVLQRLQADPELRRQLLPYMDEGVLLQDDSATAAR